MLGSRQHYDKLILPIGYGRVVTGTDSVTGSPKHQHIANLSSNGKEHKDELKDQKRLKPLPEVAHAEAISSSKKNLAHALKESEGRCQQVLTPNTGLPPCDHIIRQELESESVIVKVVREGAERDYSQQFPNKLTESVIERVSCSTRGQFRTQSMAEIVDEAEESTTEPAEQQKIAVAVGKSQSGSYALKWTLENLVSPGQSVLLLHVQAPLRYIPTPLGTKLAVEQVSEDMVKAFKMQRFRETDTLLDRYRKMCGKRQVKPEICYFENDIVQNELVDQISKLNIANLVLGTSSNSRLKKAFKGSGISSFVAKHSPNFCTVMVIYKGKLASVKDASTSLSSRPLQRCISISSTAESSMSNCDIHEEFWNTPTHGIPTGHSSFDSRILSQALATQSGSHDPPAVVLSHSISCPQGGSIFPSAPASPLIQPNDAQSIIEYPSIWSMHSNDRFESQALQTFSQRVVGKSPSSVQVHEHWEKTAAPANPPASDRAEASVSDTDNIFSNSNNAIFASEATSSVSYADALPEFGLERRDSSSPSINEAQATSEDVAVEVEELRRQLEQAKLSADRAQREALIQANRCKQAEDFVASAMKMVRESDAQRQEEIRARDDALRDAQVARQQFLREARRCEEALSALEEHKEMVKVALKDQEIHRQKKAEDTRNYLETQVALEESRRREEAAIRGAAAETRRYEEAVASLEELKKMLEWEVGLRKEAEEKVLQEIGLRKEAEEKVLQETIAKQKAIAALQKTQKRYTEYSFEELQAATNDFQEEGKLGEGGYGSVYKGKIHHTMVAIKVLKRDGLDGREEFQREVEVLSRIHHPHMVMLLGACVLKGCIVYEYMANGSLEDRLNCKDGTPPLPWYIRFRICSEVATALLFLHSRPQPIVHRDLKPGNILLDHNFVSKIGDVGLARLVPNNLTFSLTMYRDTVPVGTFAYIDPDYQRTGVVSRHSDVYALGIVMLQLLTGKPAVGVTDLVEEAVDNGRFDEVLDTSAGDWPLEAAMELACLSLQCAEPRRKHRPDLETTVISVLENIRQLADEAAGRAAANRCFSPGGEPIIPSFFLCPISQEIMENPHIAPDGFTYEHDVIKAWLHEHDTSPMTNLALPHKNLIPNFSIRSAIREWRDTNRMST